MSFFGDLLAALFSPKKADPTFGGAGASGSFASDKNVRAGLMTIRACEGTDGPDGYRMLFGGKLFDDLSKHPRIGRPFTNTDGVVQWSTAAGAYQINWPSWSEHVLPDFTPPSQDAWAIWAITQAGALEDLKAGYLELFLHKCAGRWASLPDAQYPQPKRPLDFARAAYLKAGGTLA